jgi:hypothetical protein
MKRKIILLAAAILLMGISHGWALKGVVSTVDEIDQLKQDLIAGKIKVGQTRLSNIRQQYGDASDIADTEKKITYNYGDLKIEFSKDRFLKEWSYDSSRGTVYTKNVNNLRFNLESKKLVGKNITYAKIVKDFDLPTESKDSSEDGGMSIYYYGDIKMVFNNIFTVKTWKGSRLDRMGSKDAKTVK